METIQQLTQISHSLVSISSLLAHKSFWDSQLLGVFLGAIIGLLPWIYNLYTDRPRIKVLAQNVYFPSSLLVRKGISIRIYNHGKRAINVKHVYVQFKDGSKLAFVSEESFEGGSGLPIVLGEGMSHSVNILASRFTKELLKKQEFPILAGYEDALGRAYEYKTSVEFWRKVFEKED